MKKAIFGAWNYIFDHELSPLRNIPDFGVRHMVFQMLGWMWAAAFSIAIGSYAFMAVSMIGHLVLIAAFAVTAGTYTVAAKRPKTFLPLKRK